MNGHAIMSHAVNLADLAPAQRRLLEDVLERYQAHCRQAPALTDLRAAAEELDPPLRPLALVELVGIHMEVCHNEGQRRSLEDYLARIPELRQHQAWIDRLRDWEKHLADDAPPSCSAPPFTPDSPPFTGGLLEEGGIIGGYRLVRLLGRSHAEVWLAESRGGIEVALKIIPLIKEMAGPERESLELIKNLRHPFLIGIRDYWVDGLRLYIAMDKADGSLKERLDQSPGGLPTAELVPYAEQAAQALDFLHGKKIIHRDIKPANLLLLAGFVKVADFGTVWQMEGSVTEQAGAAGTARYMAPEVFFHGRASRRSDQFSLAVTYAEMRTGHSPFQISSKGGLFAIGQALANQEPDLEGLLPAEQEVLKKALAKDSHQRFNSCVEFAEALRKALEPASTVTAESLPWAAQVPAPAAPARKPEQPSTSADSLKPGKLGGPGPVPAWRQAAQAQSVAAQPTPAAPPKRSSGSTVPPGPRTEGSVPLLPKAAWQNPAPPAQRSTAAVAAKPPASILTGIGRLGAYLLCSTACLAILDVAIVRPGHGSAGTLWLPGDSRQLGTGLRTLGGREYAEVLQLDLGQGVRVEFRYIDGGGLTPFYAMTTKVSKELFALYARGTVDGVNPAHRQRPVTNVSFEEATKFARWLGQRLRGATVQLPADTEWDRLAFRAEPPHEGKSPGFGLGVDRPLAMDRPGNLDRSDQGCLDAFSNGREWTRTQRGTLKGKPQYVLKGKDYRAEEPFSPDDPPDRHGEAQEDLGFRVVLELPDR
jgi:serine/threonine protein kinase